MDEKTPIFGDPHEREGVSKVGTSSSARQVYHDSTQNPTTVRDLNIQKSKPLKEHVALDRSSWSLESVCNRLL